jgi:hypothetical protein
MAGKVEVETKMEARIPIELDIGLFEISGQRTGV